TNMKLMFLKAKRFNQPIADWKVFMVTNMDKMFNQASSFNQNISSWCVSRIPNKPTDFAIGSPLTQNQIPNWGTCNEQANGLNGIRLTQSTQNSNHTVPMVAGRDADLRIFFNIGQQSDHY